MFSHLEQFGFKRDFATTCLNKNKHNQVTTVYYLLHKKYEREGKFRTSFKVENTPSKREPESTSPSPERKQKRRDTLDSLNEQPLKPFDISPAIVQGDDPF